MKVDTPKRLFSSSCPKCWRPKTSCLCPGIKSVKNKMRVLILQHPRESLEIKGTGRLASLSLENCTHRIGLSWPSLKAALAENVDPKNWGVLFLGSMNRKIGDSKLSLSSPLHGIIVLDGSWKEAKTLWWRNPWLLRLTRLQISTHYLSSYYPLRQQPRQECLSTVEVIAEIFTQRGEQEVASHLQKSFGDFLAISSPVHTSAVPRSEDFQVTLPHRR